ncbi:RNA recognition domain-containing protein [Phlyctema vagabunda]|uniref:RNA recognition domain-containing protein n=1 Tax=Phlyctema vagabunda TaxID=108571 RepID=A0ABR4PFM9_9HELO
MAPQDSFIDEDDDTCPLCVEEFDLSDKNFRPCPCGYQVCQFCFNNIRNNMNGLCPACRRPYDDKTIKWRVVTPEEIAQFKSNIQKNAKKKADIRQKEAQKREVETLNRKHLSGLRVIQKNLVYVLGLSPGIREDEMLQTLRGDKYFGQYGKIIKIVVQKAKQGEVVQTGQSIGVYVTFERKEDAARCIAAVNGSQNGDRVLRAQLGTTKYCSAYLRNETCTNKQCMFLHEPGDNDDSYSRHDLSSINSVSTQRPLPALASSSRSTSRQAVQAQAPIQQAQPIAAATQPMARGNSKDGSDSGDGSALPSSASWANHGMQQQPQQRSRRGSHATSGATSSPAVSYVMPATVATPEEAPAPKDDGQESIELAAHPDAPTSPDPPRPARNEELLSILKAINTREIEFVEISTKPDATQADFPPLFDIYGGEKRRAMREQQEEARLQIEQEPQPDLRPVVEPSEEEEPESGSLQLGGEPEDREHGREGGQSQGFNGQRRMSTQLPIQRAPTTGPFGGNLNQNFTQNIGNLSSINGRTLTPQQTQQLQILKSGQPQHGFMDQFSSGNGQASSVFQQQGHNRQSSRYSFANDNGPASTSSVKPSANPKLMAQQSSMMPPSSQQGNQYYGSSMPGPPPGLKSTGTPPAAMFGQGHGFGGSMGGGSVFGGSQKENNSDMLRDMLRGRGNGAGSSQIHDTGKREYMFPSFLQQYPSASPTPTPASGLLASLYGSQPGAFHDFGSKQKKKGKKHRHANTSSSGGGGLVDLADPSILQARMHQQQQSNAGVGQGLFGGQAQGGYNPNMMYGSGFARW